jgi:hypothetical protein
MNATKTETKPSQIISELLARPVVLTTPTAMRPTNQRAVALLDRQADTTIERARQAGTDIEYLGINPLFAEARLYHGVDTDWVLAPASKHEDAVVPRRERQALQRLADANIHFPLIYVAHEVPKEKTKELVPTDGKTHVVLEHGKADELVGPVPAPVGTLELGDRLAQRSNQVLRTVGRAVPMVGAAALAVVAAPVVLAGAVLGSLATLDPIILGACPAVSAAPGEPASWYVLARWDW